jgi:hypothetical protein
MEAASEPEQAPLRQMLRPEDVELCYPFVVQSGGLYDLHWSAGSNDDALVYDPMAIILVQLGCRYKSYCANIARTYLIDAPDAVNDAYTALLAAHRAATGALRAGARCSDVHAAAVAALPAATGGDALVPHLSTSVGAALGLELCEAALTLSPACDALLAPGMVFNIATGLEDVFDAAAAEGSAHDIFSLLLADTVAVTPGGAPPELLTTAKSTLADISYQVVEQEEEQACTVAPIAQLPALDGANAADAAAAELLAEEEAERTAAAAPRKVDKRRKRKKKRGDGAASESGGGGGGGGGAHAEPAQAEPPDDAAAHASEMHDPNEYDEDAADGDAATLSPPQLSAPAARRRRRAAAKAAQRRGAASTTGAAAVDDAAHEQEEPPAADADADADEAAAAMVAAAAAPLAVQLQHMHVQPVAPAAQAAQAAAASADAESPVCVICLDAPRSTLLFPCTHLALCGAPACAAMLGAPPLCPLCRAAVTDTLGGVFL